MRKDIEKRTNKYAINEKLERIIRELNDSLKDLERKEISKLTDSNLPLLFFCGAPRTGTTLISQVFAHTQEMAYTSNYTARFWEAPYLALLLEKELGLRRLLEENTHNNGYSSEYGVTKKIFEPHEFGFFWNKYIPYRANETHFIEKDAYTNDMTIELHQEIMAMLSVYEKPLFIKNMIAGLNCHYIKNVFSNSFFIIVKRDYKFVAQSILEGKRNLYGNEDTWFSLRPSKYKEIIENHNNPYDQIALQIKGVYDDISRGTEEINDRCMVLQYEDFCRAPARYLSDIFSLIGHKPENDSWIKKIPDQIDDRNKIRIPKSDYDNLCRSLKLHRAI